jgi:hypothetical protein
MARDRPSQTKNSCSHACEYSTESAKLQRAGQGCHTDILPRSNQRGATLVPASAVLQMHDRDFVFIPAVWAAIFRTSTRTRVMESFLDFGEIVEMVLLQLV